MNNQSGKWKLRSLIRKARTRPQEGSCCSFSKRAKAALRKKIRWYIVQLISESEKRAKQEQVDDVSAIHVKEAFDYLINGRSRRGRFSKHLGTIGGIFLGASLPVFLRGGYSTSVATAFCIIGVAMVAYYIAKDI